MTVGTVMALMLSAVFAVIGLTKLLAVPAVRREAAHLGFTIERYRLIGLVELAAAVGLAGHLLWVPLGIAACVGILALLVGAIVALRRAGDSLGRLVPAVALGIGAATTAGLLAAGS